MRRGIERNLKRYGTPIILIQSFKVGENLDTGEAITAEVTTQMLGIIGSFEPSEDTREIININDIKCTISTDKEVKKDDIVIYEGNRYVVVNLFKSVRNGINIKTTLQLRSKNG